MESAPPSTNCTTAAYNTVSVQYAHATLISRDSYLAGVILLAYSLHKHGSKHPLLVYYGASLSKDAVRALTSESKISNMILVPVEPLLPPRGQGTELIAASFTDIWTKLRVFSEPSLKYQKIYYLDADMLILRPDIDSIFKLPQV